MNRARQVGQRIVALLVGLLLISGVAIIAAPQANASAQTCIAATGGSVCTSVSGDGGWVDFLEVSRIKADPFNGAMGGVCDYSAWYFAAPPAGGVIDLGSSFRQGCGLGRVWLGKEVHRSFPPGTQVCAKFYENWWSTFVTQKCVGLS